METDYFNRTWTKRIKLMAKHISANKSVLDLGCGNLGLKKHLTPNNKYFPIDFIKRADEVLVYDFNKNEFPDIHADICFVSGVLEYIKNVDWFIEQIVLHSKECIISYQLKEKFPDEAFRNKNRWINNLSKEELINLFVSFEWELILETEYPYFIFQKLD